MHLLFHNFFPRNLGRLVLPFCCSAVRPYFCPVLQCNNVSHFARSLVVKWHNSGIINN